MAGEAAHRMFLWGGPNPSDPTRAGYTGWNLADLQELHSWGFRGIFVNARKLRGFGGHKIGGQGQQYRDSAAPATGDAWVHQRSIEANVSGSMNLVEYWHSLGTSADPTYVLLAWDTGKTNETNTPVIGDWFDNDVWTNGSGTGYCDVLNDLASFASWIGFDGMITDWEMFDNIGTGEPGDPHFYQPGGWKVSRAWWPNYGDYPGTQAGANTNYQLHSLAAMQAKAKERGGQYMEAILNGGITDMTVYNMWAPDNADAVRARSDGDPNIKGENQDNVPWLEWDFFKGMICEQGYTRLNLVNANFQKTYFNFEGANDAAKWNNAFKYEIGNLFEKCSQQGATGDLTSDQWNHAHSRIKWHAFPMLDAVTGHAFFVFKSNAYVSDQLTACHNWSMGERFFIFDYSGYNAAHLKTAPHDYRPQMIAAGTEEIVDTTNPTLSVPVLGPTTITGTAIDNYGIAAVRWTDNAGGSGAAEHNFVITNHASSKPAYPQFEIVAWEARWTIQRSAISSGATQATITAVDTHGRTSTPPRTVTLSGTPTTPVNGGIRDLRWDLYARRTSGPSLFGLRLNWDLQNWVYSGPSFFGLRFNWTLFNRVTSGPSLTGLNFVWTLFSRVTAFGFFGKRHIWDLRSNVDGPVLEVMWDLEGGGVAATLDLDFDLYGAVARTLTLKSDLRSEVNGDEVNLTWDTKAAVNAGVEDLTWDMRGAVARTRTLQWDLRAARQNDVDLVWDILTFAQVNAPPLRAQWDLPAVVMKKAMLRWDLLNIVEVNGVPLGLHWDLTGAVSDPLMLVWEMFTFGEVNSSPLHLRSDLAAAVFQDIDLTWDVLTFVEVNASPLQLVYDLVAEVESDIELNWDVETFGSVNSPPLQLLADLIAEIASVERGFTWDLRSVVEEDQTFGYDLRSAVNAPEEEAVWDLHSAVNSSQLTSVWDVHSDLEAVELGLAWDMRSEVDAPITDLTWDLHSAADLELFFPWDLIGTADGDPLRVVWKVGTEVVASELALVWDQFDPVDLPLELRWALQTWVMPDGAIEFEWRHTDEIQWPDYLNEGVEEDLNEPLPIES